MSSRCSARLAGKTWPAESRELDFPLSGLRACLLVLMRAAVMDFATRSSDASADRQAAARCVASSVASSRPAHTRLRPVVLLGSVQEEGGETALSRPLADRRHVSATMTGEAASTGWGRKPK